MRDIGENFAINKLCLFIGFGMIHSLGVKRIIWLLSAKGEQLGFYSGQRLGFWRMRFRRLVETVDKEDFTIYK